VGDPLHSSFTDVFRTTVHPSFNVFVVTPVFPLLAPLFSPPPRGPRLLIITFDVGPFWVPNLPCKPSPHAFRLGLVRDAPPENPLFPSWYGPTFTGFFPSYEDKGLFDSPFSSLPAGISSPRRFPLRTNLLPPPSFCRRILLLRAIFFFWQLHSFPIA